MVSCKFLVSVIGLRTGLDNWISLFSKWTIEKCEHSNENSMNTALWPKSLWALLVNCEKDFCFHEFWLRPWNVPQPKAICKKHESINIESSKFAQIKVFLFSFIFTQKIRQITLLITQKVYNILVIQTQKFSLVWSVTTTKLIFELKHIYVMLTLSLKLSWKQAVLYNTDFLSCGVSWITTTISRSVSNTRRSWPTTVVLFNHYTRFRSLQHTLCFQTFC